MQPRLHAGAALKVMHQPHSQHTYPTGAHAAMRAELPTCAAAPNLGAPASLSYNRHAYRMLKYMLPYSPVTDLVEEPEGM